MTYYSIGDVCGLSGLADSRGVGVVGSSITGAPRPHLDCGNIHRWHEHTLASIKRRKLVLSLLSARPHPTCVLVSCRWGHRRARCERWLRTSEGIFCVCFLVGCFGLLVCCVWTRRYGSCVFWTVRSFLCFYHAAALAFAHGDVKLSGFARSVPRWSAFFF